MKAKWIFLLIPAYAFANPLPQKDYEKMYSQCLDNAGAIDNGIVGACSEGVSDEAKEEMNNLYKKFYIQLKSQSSKDADKFEQAQKSWFMYRNSHCELAGIYVGSPLFQVCPMKLNIERVMQLRELNGE